MFVGHYAAGLAAKRFAPRTSLATLMVAALLADLLLWIFLFAGLEHFAVRPGITATNALDLYDYPLSHSLLMDVVWGAVLAAVYSAVRKDWRGGLVIGAAVVSHWVLDFIAHRPDMPLAPGLHKYYGLGLYNSRVGMLVVEGLIWVAGIGIYMHAMRAKRRLAGFVLWIGVALLTWFWLISLKGVPPAATPRQMGLSSSIFIGLTIAWGYWVDRLRVPRASHQQIAISAEQSG